jgi:anti-sigma factor RsiW
LDCKRVDEELVAFELAAIDAPTRAALEAHLTGCARCVSAYLALKRAIDAEEEAAAPSEMVRKRIRMVAEELTADSRQPTVAERTKPRRRAVWAMAAVAAAAMVMVPLVYRAVHRTAKPAAEETVVPTRQTVDTARATPENLAFL